MIIRHPHLPRSADGRPSGLNFLVLGAARYGWPGPIIELSVRPTEGLHAGRVGPVRMPIGDLLSPRKLAVACARDLGFFPLFRPDQQRRRGYAAFAASVLRLLSDCPPTPPDGGEPVVRLDNEPGQEIAA